METLTYPLLLNVFLSQSLLSPPTLISPFLYPYCLVSILCSTHIFVSVDFSFFQFLCLHNSVFPQTVVLSLNIIRAFWIASTARMSKKFCWRVVRTQKLPSAYMFIDTASRNYITLGFSFIKLSHLIHWNESWFWSDLPQVLIMKKVYMTLKKR